jgi:hypothetical protein
MSDHAEVVARTRRWISSVVIGLNLCPFAQRVFDGDKIRYVVSTAQDARALSHDLAAQLIALAAMPTAAVETTLLIHPEVLTDFLDYNDFLDVADQLLVDLGLEGIIQIASFHPAYQFGDTAKEAVENYTNRSPYPMLHLLREESINAITDDPELLLDIPERNIATLRALGVAKILDLLK